ncbi:hypothetical protein BBAD15_g8442 [Beauveria bassiana D1-5]|uniref:ADF-H domain-containing protein n=1 Tax=Beauveria bassiana D1-5 TaxID=1245745 RepID=A0A0A2VJF2_BEABA|nr:hypothetical protein BBAD15_g8442 [Beauveria bassiana D1-5]
MAETLSRQTRSNSLQRMLDLEKQYMSQRLRTGSNQSKNPGVTFNSLPSSSGQRPVTKGRQIETQTVQERRQSEQRQRSFPLQTHAPKPQLVIDVNTASSKPSASSIRQPAINMKIRRSSKNIADTPPSVPYSSTVQASPNPVSGTDSSVCQSPSWEAYDKRKQEKKEERRARDEAKATRKPRRLSKPPPDPSPCALAQAKPNQSEPLIAGNGRKPRPSSMSISDNPSKEATFYKQPRSRAGSFSTLIRSTFDFRRSSIDQSQERPFIGGIKLEYEQHLASERDPNLQSAIDLPDVHPALRTSNTSLKSPPPPPRATDSKSASSRAYPPNTFATAKAKSMSLVSPTAPPVPDLSTIEKWRARVRLRSSSKSSSSRSPVAKDTGPASNTHDDSNKSDASSEEAARRDGDTEHAKEKTPPPEPPRRSSKRESMTSGSFSMPVLSAPLMHVPLETDSSSFYDLSFTAAKDDNKQPSASPSWENLQSSVMDTIEHTVKPKAEIEKEEVEKAFWNSQEWAIQRSDVPQITSSSSEDSASDCFNTVSMQSTPNTSRPQSEKGIPRNSGESERFTLPRIQLHDNAYPSEACSFVSSSLIHGAYDVDGEVDPIQAAARKVMAALPPMPSARPAIEHEALRLRSNDIDTSSISDLSLIEVPKLSPRSPKAQPAKRANGDTVAKVFVECCGCKYYHDMPSKLKPHILRLSRRVSFVIETTAFRLFQLYLSELCREKHVHDERTSHNILRPGKKQRPTTFLPKPYFDDDDDDAIELSIVADNLFSEAYFDDDDDDAIELSLYTFSGETKEHLRKFRLSTSRAKDPQAVIYLVDKNTQEIRQDDDKTVYKTLEEIGDDLPDHSPRFVLLSYPLTLSDGRASVPYVLLYYLPETCNAEMRMIYAGAKELMRSTSEAGRVIDIRSVEDLEDIPKKLASD